MMFLYHAGREYVAEIMEIGVYGKIEEDGSFVYNEGKVISYEEVQRMN